MWTYSPSDVSVTYAGKPLEGFGEDSFVSISRELPLYTSKRAMDGSVSVTQQRYSKWNVRVSLAQSSPSNNFLDGMQKFLFENNVTVMEYLPLIIKDGSGSTMFFAKDVWIDSVPEQSFGAGVSLREWSFTCNDVYSIIGGNSEDLDSVTEALAAVNALYAGLKASSNVVRAVGGLL